MIIGISGKLGSGKDEIGKIIKYFTSRGFEDYGNQYKYETYCRDVMGMAISSDAMSGFEIKRYANKLKDIVCLIIGCTREQLEDQEFKMKPLGDAWDKFTEGITDANTVVMEKMTPRLMLQLVGTEGGRDLIHPNIWVNSLFADYKLSDDMYEFLEGIPYTNEQEEALFPKWIITDMRFPNELLAVKYRRGITIRVNRTAPEHDERGFAVHRYSQNHSSETALDDATFDYVIDNNGGIDDLVHEVREILLTEKII